MPKHTQTAGQLVPPAPTSVRSDADQAAHVARRRRVSASRPASKKGRSLQARPALDTLELPSAVLHPLEQLRDSRRECRKVADLLNARGGFIPGLRIPNDDTDPLHKAAQKIRACSLLGAFAHLDNNVNYRVGTALCKNRLCPNCQRVLAAKRKTNFLEWFDRNLDQLHGFRFYHLVLTVRHSRADGLRDELYTGQLLRYFLDLRGNNSRDNRRWWNDRVAGGTFSVEPKPGRDGSPHIHIHCFLLAKMPLWRKDRPSAFLQEVWARWASITGEDVKKVRKGVHVEPVYYLDGEGNRVYAEKLSDTGNVDAVRRAVSECIKYTIKSDEASLSGFSTDFLRELLQVRNRYYGRFGILNATSSGSKIFKDLGRLATDFKDLEQVAQQELRWLLNPDTGDLVPPAQAPVAITWFSNTRARTVDVSAADAAIIHQARKELGLPGAPAQRQLVLYEFADLDQVQTFGAHEKKEVQMRLAYSLKHNYRKDKDISTE